MTLRREFRAFAIARFAAWLAAGVGAIVLIGWNFEIELFKRLSSAFVSMKANTALGFLFAGIALLLSMDRPGVDLPFEKRRWRRFLVALLITSIGAIGAVTFFEYVAGVDLGIDQAFYIDRFAGDAPFFGRMAWATALSFVAIALALAVPRWRIGRFVPAQWLALAVFFNGYVALLAYAYDFESLYRVVMYTSMALHTAFLTAVLGIGILAAFPTVGFMSTVLSDGAGGVMFRRIVPVALVLPMLVSGAQLYIGGSDQTGFGQAVSALCNAAVFIGLGWWTARSLRVAERAREVAQAGLKVGEERLGIALQSAAGGAWDWDLHSNIAWWSPEMYALWNVKPGSVMELENSLAQIHDGDRETVQRAVERAISERRAYECEFRIVRDGAEAWMLSRGKVVYDASDRPERLVGITFDITANKVAEQRLRLLNEALQSSNAELRRFAHIAAHDLQTPMRSIASFAELLASKRAETLDPQARDWLARISLSVHRLQALVDALLRYASIEASSEEFVPVAMNEIFDSSVVLLRARIEEASAVVTRDALPTVLGDAGQLQELMRNLIDNAVKHSDRKSTRVHVTAEKSGKTWRLTVRDDGPGIDARFHARIFDMFERLQGQDAQSGTGVGLAICRKIVERHGGAIWVESEPDRGSAFHFTLIESASAASRRHPGS